ncbi:MAG: rRNA maturation RNase YbeY [Pseudomonadota bacterium]
MSPGPVVEVIVEEAGWETALPEFETVAEAAAIAALRHGGLGSTAVEVAILGCSDDRIAAFNGQFRSKAQPTNVLAWPSLALAPPAPGEPPPAAIPPPDGTLMHLGDVAVALQTTSAEAKAASIPLKDHVAHLILHGCLHLLGFDHQTDLDAARMEGAERHLLNGLGIPDPYERIGAGHPQP